MAWIKLNGNKVEQKQLTQELGFIQAPDYVCCGMIRMSANVYENPDPLLDDIKAAQCNQLRLEYETSCLMPVPVAGVDWDGGFESAMKLDAAQRLADKAGLSEVTFYDTYNQAHALSLANALQIVIGVAVAFQTKLAKKQGYFQAIADADTVEAVQQIIWQE